MLIDPMTASSPISIQGKGQPAAIVPATIQTPKAQMLLLKKIKWLRVHPYAADLEMFPGFEEPCPPKTGWPVDRLVQRQRSSK